jgi:phosphoglycerol transferase
MSTLLEAPVCRPGEDEVQDVRTSRWTGWVRPAVVYLGTALLSLLMASYVLKFHRADYHLPFVYQGDSIWYLNLFEGLLSNGTYLFHPRLGFPTGQDLRDFPVAEGWLNYGLVWLLSRAGGSHVVGLNLFVTLGFPVVALSALAVLRRLGVAWGPAVVCAILYTLLPAHFLRMPHVFLAAYYLVPLGVYLALKVFQGEGHWTFRRVLLAVAVGMGGVYYAFFTCLLLVTAGLARGLYDRSWRGPARAFLWVAVIFLALLSNLAPAMIQKHRHDPNPYASQRFAFEADLYALKVTQMLLPIDDHRLRQFREVKAEYNSFQALRTEAAMSSLGLLGSLGFVGLVGFGLLGLARQRRGLAQALAAFTLVCVLLASVGGFGSLFSLLITPWIRAYNRVSVVIGFLALTAIALVLDRLARRWATTPLRQVLFLACLAGLLAFGFLDQTTPAMALNQAAIRPEWEEDAAFGRRIEEAVGDGPVFQFPAVFYPEHPNLHNLTSPDLLRPCLHTRHTRWSYGGLRGHEGDHWMRWVAAMPLDRLLPTLARAGVAGIHLDRNGFEDRGKKLERDLTEALNVEPWVSTRERYSFFDLRPYREQQERQAGPQRWRRQQEETLAAVLFVPGEGFSMDEKPTYRGLARTHTGLGNWYLINRLERTRNLKVRFRLAPAWHPVATTVGIRTPEQEWQLDVPGKGRWVELTMTAPPGKTLVVVKPTRLTGSGQLYISDVDYAESDRPAAR